MFAAAAAVAALAELPVLRQSFGQECELEVEGLLQADDPRRVARDARWGQASGPSSAVP